MPQVICTLPNAANVISGYKFSPHSEGKISEDLPDDTVSRLTSIAGYKLANIESAQVQVVEISLARPAKK